MIVCMYIVNQTGYEEFRTGSDCDQFELIENQSRTCKLVIVVLVKVLFIFVKTKTDFIQTGWKLNWVKLYNTM